MPLHINNFNLLISTPRHLENKACVEVWFLLGEIGDRESVVEKTGITGLVVAKTAIAPVKAVENLRRLLKESPQEFRYTLRVIPIEVVTRTRLEEISEVGAKLASMILENETFRITVEKRHSELSTKDIIKTIAEKINRKVNLDNPDRIMLVEVLGGTTGISMIRPNGILSVAKEGLSSGV